MFFFGKRRKAKTAIDRNIIQVLEMLVHAEQKIAKFYHLCAETLQADKEFWRKMAESERRHVKYLRNMQEIYLENPHQFQADFPFDIAAIRLFDLSLRELPDRARLEEIGRPELLQIVERIENSAVEMNYGKVIKSANADFSRLAARLETESIEHRQIIAGMAAEA